MTTVYNSPIVRGADGSIDLGGFAVAGVDNTTIWLENHLLGKGSETSFGTNFDDAPYETVTSLLRKGGLGNPSSVVLGQSITVLLQKVENELPGRHRLFSDLLAICRAVSVPASVPWFFERLSTMVLNRSSFFKNWLHSDLRKDFVAAAAVQIPAHQTSRSSEVWEKVIAIPELATVALFAFGFDLVSQLPHLEGWWKSCPIESRNLELEQLLETDVGSDRNYVLSKLREYGSRWPSDLKTQIDRCLAKFRISCVFGTQTINTNGVSRELVHAESLLAMRNEDPDERSRVERILRSDDVVVVASRYTGAPALESLHKRICDFLFGFGLQPIHRDTETFNELSDFLFNELTRCVYTFPLYLTKKKRNHLFVIPYGEQTEIGILLPKNSNLRQQWFEQEGRWTLEDVLRYTIRSTSGIVYCPEHYAMSEFVEQCVETNPNIGMVDSKRIRVVPLESGKSSHRRGTTRRFRHAPRDTAGKDWIYLFDLGDRHAVEHDVKVDHTLQGAETHRLPHRLSIPVGVGFNLLMAPWLMQDDHSKVLLENVIAPELAALKAPLRKIGVVATELETDAVSKMNRQ